MVSMCTALQQVKQDPFAVLQPQVIEQLCQELGHAWRDGPLNPTNTVALFIQQVAEGNVSCSEVRHIADQTFSASAYCQARQRLPLELLTALAGRVLQAGRELAATEPVYGWHGHRTWIIDGSSFSMSDTPELQEHFGQPAGQAAGCGFPTAHLLALFDAHSGLLAQPQASPLLTSDLKHCQRMHQQMQEGDILLGDDTFSSWAHFALLLQAKMHAVMPNQHQRIVSFQPGRPHALPGNHQSTSKGLPRSRFIRRLGADDQLVEWFKPKECPPWLSGEEYAKLPESITVREVRRTIPRKGFRPLEVTVVTTLLDERAYPAQELVQLRMIRWNVETNLGHLKTTMNMDVLHCKTLAGVQKELAVFVLVYNLVRAVMLQAARWQKVPVDRLSFADALQWLRHADAGDALPELEVVPYRPDRLEPRAVKRRPKEYDRLTKPRAQLRQKLRDSAMEWQEND